MAGRHHPDFNEIEDRWVDDIPDSVLLRQARGEWL